MSVQTKKILTKLRLVQWHYFNNEIIELKNTNLFSGDNGAGKSTILDAIQLILTTNSRKFNLAANSESKRTLKGYVRGKTGDEGNEYLRKGYVISYAALEVYEESKNRYFVIGGKFDSPDIESSVNIKWFCEEGNIEDLSFIVGNRPAAAEQFRNKGKKVSFIYSTSAAKDRFRHRLGNLQENFFELLARSMTFKPMKDVKSFVSQFILPEKNVDIDNLRENIRVYSEYQDLVRSIGENVNALENIKQVYNSIKRIDEQILVIDILLKIAEQEAKISKINKLTEKCEMKQQMYLQYQSEKNSIDSSAADCSERLIDIKTAVNSGENALLISGLKRDINEKNKEIANEKYDLGKLKEQLKRIGCALKAIRSSTASKEQLLSIEDADISTEEKNSLIHAIKSEFDKKRSDMYDASSRLKIELEGMEKVLERLSAEIKRLERNEITYDRNVIELKAAVEREFRSRGIDSPVYIFSDLLEISDIRWQNAVEGYLNTQRFHIIIEPEYYDIAAKIYERLKSQIHTAAVVDTAKLRLDAECSENSLASAVFSENRYARAYADHILGRVTMCCSVNELRGYSIAITGDCMLYQGKTLRRIDPDIYKMPYIGKNAVKKQLEQKRAEYELITEGYSKRSKEKTEIDNSLKALEICNFDILFDVIDAPEKLKRLVSEADGLKIKLRDAENDPTYLQLQIEMQELESIIAEKKKRSDVLTGYMTECNLFAENANKESALLREEISEIENNITLMSTGNDDSLANARKKWLFRHDGGLKLA